MKRLQHATRRAERDGVAFGALVPIELTVMYKSQSICVKYSPSPSKSRPAGPDKLGNKISYTGV